MSFATLQDAVDSLRADNTTLTDQLIDANQLASQAQTEAEDARVAAQLAETNAKQSEALADQHKAAAEAAVPLAEQHKLDAQAQVPLAQAEKTGAEAARDAAVLTALGPDNDKLASIASVYSQPSLNLDFAKQSFWKQGKYPWNQETLDPAVDLTFTRASTATYFDKNGVLQTAAADEMRIDHDPVTGEPLGVLIERSATNLLFPSDQAPWGGRNQYSETITANAAVAPDGTETAARIETRVNGASRFQYALDSQPKGTHRAISYYYKREDSQVGAPLAFSSPVNLNLVDEYDEVAANGYTRYVAVVEYEEEAEATLRLYYDGMAGTGSSCLIWGAQLEEGPFPTSYIPTAGASVTRAADALSYALGGEYVQAAGTFTVEGAASDANGGFLAARSPTNDYAFYINQLESHVRGVIRNNGAASASRTMTAAPSEWHKAAMALDSQYMRLAIGGVAPMPTPHNGAPTNVGAVSIGSFQHNANHINGHIKAVAYYPRAMTEAELIEVTS